MNYNLGIGIFICLLRMITNLSTVITFDQKEKIYGKN